MYGVWYGCIEGKYGSEMWNYCNVNCIIVGSEERICAIN